MLTYDIPPEFRSGEPPYAIGSVPSLSGHAIAYRWRSLPRVRRHRASKPQGSSELVLPLQVTINQLICASLLHTHYWYEVGMLKVLYHYYFYIKLNRIDTMKRFCLCSLCDNFPPCLGDAQKV